MRLLTSRGSSGSIFLFTLSLSVLLACDLLLIIVATFVSAIWVSLLSSESTKFISEGELLAENSLLDPCPCSHAIWLLWPPLSTHFPIIIEFDAAVKRKTALLAMIANCRLGIVQKQKLADEYHWMTSTRWEINSGARNVARFDFTRTLFSEKGGMEHVMNHSWNHSLLAYRLLCVGSLSKGKKSLFPGVGYSHSLGYNILSSAKEL